MPSTSDKSNLGSNWRRYRLPVLIVGIVLVILAFAVDAIGLGRPGDFGRGQWILLIIGVTVAVFSLAGPARFADWYRSAALIMLNTVLLLVCLELGSIVLARSGLLPPTTLLPEYRKHDFYQNQKWGKTLWEEASRAERYQYTAYTLWRHQPFTGQLININEEGVRRTPGANCGPDSYTVYMLGGSSMWGWGSPDWATIPAYVQEKLSRVTDTSICVVNLGEDAYVSTQGVITVMRELQLGRVPDLVVSLDGVNDVYAAYASGMAGVLTNRAEVAQRLHDKSVTLSNWLMQTRTAELMRRVTLDEDAAIPTWLKGKDEVEVRALVEELAAGVSEVYLSNKRMVEALGNSYGFDVIYFWPPHLSTTGKRLTGMESVMQSRIHSAWADIARESTRLLCDLEKASGGVRCLTDVLDDFVEAVWIDDWSHMTPVANRRIAEIMAGVISDTALP